MIFYTILFDFLDNFILLFQYIWFLNSCMFKYFIIVHLFIDFMQAVVYWCAYEYCFVVSVIS